VVVELHVPGPEPLGWLVIPSVVSALAAAAKASGPRIAPATAHANLHRISPLRLESCPIASLPALT
jgi:hypothetical protein